MKTPTFLSCNTTMLSTSTTTNVPAKISPLRRNSNNTRPSWQKTQLRHHRRRAASPFFACPMLHRLKQTYGRRAAAAASRTAVAATSDGLWRDGVVVAVVANENAENEYHPPHGDECALQASFVPPPTTTRAADEHRRSAVLVSTSTAAATAAASSNNNNAVVADDEERDAAPTVREQQQSIDEHRENNNDDDDASHLLSAWKKKHHIEEEQDDDDDDDDMDLIDLSDDTDSCASSLFHNDLSPIQPPRPRRHVHFAEWRSTVVMIPSHRDYSQQEKLLIWTSPATVRQNAKRAAKEWRYEGKDYRRVLEEDEFVSDAHGNQWHPVHFLGAPQPKQKSKQRRQQQQTITNV